VSGPPEHTEPPFRPSEIGIAISEQELEGFQHRSTRPSAEFRIMLRDLLDEYGYPPEECERAVETVLEQAKLNARNHGSASA
jgi:hypothetical protein